MGKYGDIARLTTALLKEPHRARSIYLNFVQGKGAGVMSRIAAEQIVRVSVQISDWRDALEMWESVDNPDRYKMMELYQEIALDDQVTAKMKTVRFKVNATEYYIYDRATKKENDDILYIFDRRWFMDVVNHMIDAEGYGHSLIQFGDWNVNEGYNHREIEIVPRHLVSPELGIVRFSTSNTQGIHYRDEKIYSRHLVEIGDKYDKGFFSSLAPPFIFKKNAQIYWSDFQQRYGEPIITFNTDLQNKKNADRLYDFIMNRGRNSGVVMDTHDVAQILETERRDAYRVYSEMIKRNDDAISKIIEGQTLTTDSGQGKYSGDIHADTALLFHLGRLKSIRYYINDELLPKMRRDGFSIKDTEEFRWREFKNIDEIVNRLVKLALYYHIDPETIYKLTGINVGEEKEEFDQRKKNTKRTPDSDDK